MGYFVAIYRSALKNIQTFVLSNHSFVGLAKCGRWTSFRFSKVHATLFSAPRVSTWNAICYDLPILDELLKPIVESLPEEPKLPDNMDEFV